eukprot:COSAG01_NODE_302_length_19206_cov_11.098687_21_plen_324_part_00
MPLPRASVDWEKLRDPHPGSGTGKRFAAGWVEAWDQASGRYYYYNTTPGAEAVTWAAPPELKKAAAARWSGGVDEVSAALWGAAQLHCRRLARSTASRDGRSGWQRGRLYPKQRKRPTLSAFEFGHFMRLALFCKPRLCNRVFTLLDLNGDGELSRKEWTAALELFSTVGRREARAAFLFQLVDPAGPGRTCSQQLTGKPAKEIDEGAVNYFFERFLVAAEDTVDVVLGAVEQYFGLAVQSHVRRGDGTMQSKGGKPALVPGRHIGKKGTHRPTGRPAGRGGHVVGAANQGVHTEQGLEHADYFRPEAVRGHRVASLSPTLIW